MLLASQNTGCRIHDGAQRQPDKRDKTGWKGGLTILLLLLLLLVLLLLRQSGATEEAIEHPRHLLANPKGEGNCLLSVDKATHTMQEERASKRNATAQIFSTKRGTNTATPTALSEKTSASALKGEQIFKLGRSEKTSASALKGEQIFRLGRSEKTSASALKGEHQTGEEREDERICTQR
jgi:hypothetical protein